MSSLLSEEIKDSAFCVVVLKVLELYSHEARADSLPHTPLCCPLPFLALH